MARIAREYAGGSAATGDGPLTAPDVAAARPCYGVGMVGKPVFALLALLVAACGPSPAKPQPPSAPSTTIAWGLVLHGGAGTMPRDKLTPEREAAVRAALEQALRAGHAVLARGGSSL